MQSLRFGSAVSAVALASMIAGCAAPASRNGPAFNAAKANLAYGLRAQIALEAGDFTSAIDFAEKAVEGTPQDSTVRGLLGNSYFAAGRFASAEAAYGDSLSLAPVQPQVILKRAHVQIAQGKNGPPPARKTRTPASARTWRLPMRSPETGPPRARSRRRMFQATHSTHGSSSGWPLRSPGARPTRSRRWLASVRPRPILASRFVSR